MWGLFVGAAAAALAPVGPGALIPLKMAIASADSVGNDVYVAVVVDFGNGSTMTTVSKCVPVASNAHDADALAAAVGSDNVAYASSGLLCAIDNYPANGVQNCGQSVGIGRLRLLVVLAWLLGHRGSTPMTAPRSSRCPARPMTWRGGGSRSTSRTLPSGPRAGRRRRPTHRSAMHRQRCRRLRDRLRRRPRRQRPRLTPTAPSVTPTTASAGTGRRRAPTTSTPVEHEVEVGRRPRRHDDHCQRAGRRRTPGLRPGRAGPAGPGATDPPTRIVRPSPAPPRTGAPGGAPPATSSRSS